MNTLNLKLVRCDNISARIEQNGKPIAFVLQSANNQWFLCELGGNNRHLIDEGFKTPRLAFKKFEEMHREKTALFK